jgi:hypothetical protein
MACRPHLYLRTLAFVVVLFEQGNRVAGKPAASRDDQRVDYWRFPELNPSLRNFRNISWTDRLLRPMLSLLNYSMPLSAAKII